MSDDWNAVTKIGKSANRGGGGGGLQERVIKGTSALNAAQRSGAAISSEKKYSTANAGASSEGQRLTKVDRSDEIIAPKTVGMDVGKMIAARRQEKNKTRDQLAKECNIPAATLAGFENGNGAPDQEVFNKIEKALNMHFRGAKIGQPKLGPPKKKA